MRGLHAGLDRGLPVVTHGVGVFVETEGMKHREDARLGVIRLVVAHDLEREDLGLAVGRAALDGVELHHAVGVFEVLHLVADIHPAFHAVEPAVLRHHVFRPLEAAFDAPVGVPAVAVVDDQRRAVGRELACGGVVPLHLGGQTAARELRDVAGFAGDVAGVHVQRRGLNLAVEVVAFVRRLSVARHATRRLGVVRVAAHELFVAEHHVGDVARTADIVVLGLMALLAREVQAIGRHVHVFSARGVDQRAVHVAVLHAVAAAAVEVALAAGVARGRAHMLRNVGEILRFDERLVGAIDLAAAGTHRDFFHRRIAADERNLVISLGLIVAHQAVHMILAAVVERHELVRVGAAIAHMAHGAELLVADRADAEVVVDVVLAHQCLGLGVVGLPRPVNGGHDLLGRVGVAAQAGLGHLLRRGERALELRKLAVILRHLLAHIALLHRGHDTGHHMPTILRRVGGLNFYPVLCHEGCGVLRPRQGAERQ